MNRKGVCYDTRRIVDGRSWRPEFDPAETRRELAIIRNDLASPRQAMRLACAKASS